MTTWNSISENVTDSYVSRLAVVEQEYARLNEPMSSDAMTDLNIELSLVEYASTPEAIDASAEEYRLIMLNRYNSIASEISYWNASLTARTVPANAISIMQDYLVNLALEKAFYFQDWEGDSGDKASEWQTDYISAYFSSVPNTAINLVKTASRSTEDTILTNRIAILEAFNAVSFSVTAYIHVSGLTVATSGVSGIPATALLAETSDPILNEDGSYILLEQ